MSQLTPEQVKRAQQTVLGWMFHTSEYDTNRVSIGREGVGQLSDLLHDWVAFKAKIDTLEAELTKEREARRQALKALRKIDAHLDFGEEIKPNESIGEFEDPSGINKAFALARSILSLEGSEPNEGA